MSEIDKLIIKITADNAEFKQKLDEVNKQLKKVSDVKISGKGFDAAKGSVNGLNGAVSALNKNLILITTALAAIGAVKGLVMMGANLEKAQFSMAGLINSTTQFYDAAGKPVNAVENLNKSLIQSKRLYAELQAQGRDLAGVTTEDLTSAATAALPGLATLGITDAKQQAELIGTIAGSLKQLGLAYNEIQQKVEIRALLSGDVTKAGADFGRLVASVNGGTDAFKRNFEAAKQNGTAYEFLKTSMLAFQASSNLAAQSLDNQFSVIQDSVTMIGQKIGAQLLEPMKQVAQLTLGTFFQEFEEGGQKVTKFNEEVLNSAEAIGTDLGNGLKGLAPLIQPLLNLAGEMSAAFAKAFGEIIRQNEDVIKALGDLLNFIASAVGFVTDRIGSIVVAFRGMGEAIIGLSGMILTSVVKVFTDMVNAVINKINGMIGAVQAPINAIIAGMNNAFKQNIKPLDIKLAKIPDKALTDAGKKSGNLLKKGLQDTFTGVKGGILGDKAIGINVKPNKGSVQEFEKLFAGSKINPSADSGKGGKGAAEKAAREAAASDKALFNEKQKTDLLNKEFEIKKQVNALEVELAKITDPVLKAQKEKQKAILESVQPLQLQLQNAQAELAYLEQHKVKTSELATARTKIQEISTKIQEAEMGINSQYQIAIDKAKEAEALHNKKLAGTIEEAKYQQNLHNQRLLELNLEGQIAIEKDKKKKSEMEIALYKMQQLGHLQSELALTTQQTNAMLNQKMSQQELLDLASQVLAGDTSRLQTLGLTWEQQEQLIQQLMKMVGLTNQLSEANLNVQNKVDQSTKSCNKMGDAFESLKNAAKEVGQALSDAIGTAIKDGTFDLNNFASGILSTVLNMIAEIATNALTSKFGGGGFKLLGKKDGGIIKAATGGFLSGAGTGRSDSIPAMLSNGEFVVNAAATKSNRALLEAINSGKQIKMPRIQRFAAGGMVNPSLNISKLSPLSNTMNSQQSQTPVNISIQAMDGQSVLRVLGTPEGRQAISTFAVQAVQKQSNKAFNRSPFE